MFTIRCTQTVPEAQHVVADATGVGTPVVEMITRDLFGLSCDLSEGVFTGGERLTAAIAP